MIWPRFGFWQQNSHPKLELGSGGITDEFNLNKQICHQPADMPVLPQHQQDLTRVEPCWHRVFNETGKTPIQGPITKTPKLLLTKVGGFGGKFNFFNCSKFTLFIFIS